MRCCCGKYDLDSDGLPYIVNDYQHEALLTSLERNFCGPKIDHDLRDAHEEVDRLRLKGNDLAKALEENVEQHLRGGEPCWCYISPDDRFYGIEPVEHDPWCIEARAALAAWRKG